MAASSPHQLETEDRAQVELEHRRLNRHGRAVRAGVDGAADWALYLRRFLDLAEGI